MEKNQLTERNTCVDVMKAILIIAMVTGHSTSPLVTYIYLFHMPAFLVLSGYTYHGEKYSIGKYISKKFSTILIPAVMINLIFITFYSLIQLTSFYDVISDGEPIALWERVKGLFLYLRTSDLGGATWFLFVLFEIECIVKVLDDFSRKIRMEKIFFICIFAVGAAGYLLTIYALPLSYYLDLSMLGCLYYGAGILLQRTELLSQIDRKVMLPFSVISTVFFGQFYFYGKLPMNWPTRDFSNLFIQLWSCFAAMYVIWYFAGRVNASVAAVLFQWIGRHTYCILIMHFVAFRCLFGIGILIGKVPREQLQRLTPDVEITYKGGWVVIAFAAVFLCCVIAKAAEKNRWTNYLFNGKVPYKN